jgi:hypothetical protein
LPGQRLALPKVRPCRWDIVRLVKIEPCRQVWCFDGLHVADGSQQRPSAEKSADPGAQLATHERIRRQ